jgi:hypothetical protein
VETFSEKTADAAATLAERLHHIASSNSGKTPSWHVAKASDSDAGVMTVDPEATPAWTSKGSPGEVFSRSQNANANSMSYTPNATITLNGVGPDDFALSEALLVFFLQIVGDPTPFIPTKLRRPSIIADHRGNADLDALRERYLASRKVYRSSQGCGDSAGLSGFLTEFVHTQMFQCFSMLRGGDGKNLSADSNNHFFLCASMISQLEQPFDKVKHCNNNKRKRNWFL